MVHGVNGGLGHCGESVSLPALVVCSLVTVVMFAFSEKEVDSVGYCIMFTPLRDWAPFVRNFNAELSCMRLDGSLDRIIAPYQARE